jgi:hypothetical protein
MSILPLLAGCVTAAGQVAYKIAYQAAMDKFEAQRHAMMPILKNKKSKTKL